jgi:hypothetical protein
MPQTITIAAFVFGAVLVLIALIGGRFKIFGAEVSEVVGRTARVIAAVAGIVFIGIGLYGPFTDKQQVRDSRKEETPAPVPVPKPAPPPVPPPTEQISPTQPFRQAQGATVFGQILYSGTSIGSFTDADCILRLIPLDKAYRPGKDDTFELKYNNKTGRVMINNVPPGQYSPDLRIEVSPPFDKLSGGDFRGRFWEKLIVPPNKDVVEQDFNVDHVIHLLAPIDNNFPSPSQINLSSPIHFRWKPVPMADVYRLTISQGWAENTKWIVDVPVKETEHVAHLKVSDQPYHFSLRAKRGMGDIELGKFYHVERPDNHPNARGELFEFRVVSR